MSESVRKLNENPVTALADTDYIVCCDASGALRPIKKSDFLKGIELSCTNLVKSTIYSSNTPGAKLTKGLAINKNNHRISLAHALQEAGLYALSFWAKSPNGAKSITMDINDIRDSYMSGLKIEKDWHFYSTVLYVNNLIGEYGFIDVDNGEGIIISDLCLVKGSVPMNVWIPAPEDILDRLTALENRWGG